MNANPNPTPNHDHRSKPMSKPAFQKLAADPRDNSPDDMKTFAPDVNAVYLIFPQMQPVDQDVFTRNLDGAHQTLTSRHSDRDLCGVQHWEEVEIWQIPHAGRAQIRKANRQLERQHGRRFAMIELLAGVR